MSPLQGRQMVLAVPLVESRSRSITVLTWQHASGHENWSYSWTPSQLGAHTLKTRAVDDSGNIETHLMASQ